MTMNSFYEQNQKNGVKVKKIITVPLELLDFNPERNIRPINEDHVQRLAEEYKKNGPDALPPLKVVFNDDGFAEGVEGFHRYQAALIAGLPNVPCQPFTGNAIQKLGLMVKSSEGLPLTALQRADAYKAMIDAGATLQEIADEVLTSKTDVEDKLILARAPESVREMVQNGLVSATEAIKVLRKNSAGDAEKILEEAVKRALENGKGKATASDTKQQFPAKKARRLAELMSYAQWDGALLSERNGKKPESFTFTFDDIEAAKELCLLIEDYTATIPE